MAIRQLDPECRLTETVAAPSMRRSHDHRSIQVTSDLGPAAPVTDRELELLALLLGDRLTAILSDDP